MPKIEIDWELIYQLRCRAKRGERLYPEEQKLVERAWKADPERYAALDKPVFEATKPFGAD